MTRANVRIGPVSISADRVTEGLELGPDGIDGWNDAVDMRREDIAIPQAPGSFDLPGLPAARVLTIAGRCVASSVEKLGWYRSQVTGLLTRGDSGRIVVEEFGLTTWAQCRLASRTKWQAWGGQPYADFQLQLWCPDPRRYGEVRTFPGGAAAYHYGNFPASPVLTVTGSAAGGYTINGPSGKTFTVTKALVSGHPHTIDMVTGRLTVDGAVQIGAVGRAQTWAIPPGATVAMTSTAGTLTAAVTDTYI